MNSTMALIWQDIVEVSAKLFESLQQVDSRYLFLAMLLLVCFQLGRIAKALKNTGGLPKNLPQRISNMNSRLAALEDESARLRSMSVAVERRHKSHKSNGSKPDGGYLGNVKETIPARSRKSSASG